MKRQKVDIQLIAGRVHEVVFTPRAVQGRRWIKEDWAVDPSTVEIAAYCETGSVRLRQQQVRP
jgi:hypothetical protein